MNIEDLELAKKAREYAHAPASNFKVGCVLRTKSGKIYTGCNVENQGIQSICAERTAFVKAISEGERDFESITVVGGNEGTEPTIECTPCGYCRQFMSEFVDKDFTIYTIEKDYKMSDLLPHSFGL